MMDTDTSSYRTAEVQLKARGEAGLLRVGDHARCQDIPAYLGAPCCKHTPNQSEGPVSPTFRILAESDPFSSPPPLLLWFESPSSLPLRLLHNSLPTHLLPPPSPPYRLSSTQEPDQALLAVKDKPAPDLQSPHLLPISLYNLIFDCFPPHSLHHSHTGLLAIPSNTADMRPPQDLCVCPLPYVFP